MPVPKKIYRGLVSLLIFVTACSAVSLQDPILFTPETGTPFQEDGGQMHPSAVASATEEMQAGGSIIDDTTNLGSLEQVDEYPLYTMTIYGDYRSGMLNGSKRTVIHDTTDSRRAGLPPTFACSLFVTLADPGASLYGRNFDWEYSPALFLFTDPPYGYASVSMVNLAFIRRWGDEVMDLAGAPLDEIEDLLQAPFLPIDGMNEHGLVVGMAAVPSSPKPYDDTRETISSLGIIREMLDHAQNVDEAVAILESYNIDWSGGPPIHYLIADQSGEAVLVEYYDNEMVVIPAGGNWHQATNFLVSSDPEAAEGRCWRYDTINQQLTGSGGKLAPDEAMALLADVAQGGTQWSVVYDLGRGEIHIVMGRDYDQVITFHMGN